MNSVLSGLTNLARITIINSSKYLLESIKIDEWSDRMNVNYSIWWLNRVRQVE